MRSNLFRSQVSGLRFIAALALAGVASAQVGRVTDSLTVSTLAKLPSKADPGSTSPLEIWLSTTTADRIKYRNAAGTTTFTLATITDLVAGYQPLDAALTALAGGSDFVTFSGPATSTKTFTLPNASATILTDNALVTGAQGGTGVNNSGKTITLGGNLTTSGAFALTLTLSGTTGVTLPTSGTLVGSADTGTVTNTMLAGSIANAKLSNSAITIAGTSTSLGGTITLDTITGLAATGILSRTAANTLTPRTITGTANEITSTNGDGVSGNPTLSLPTSLTFTSKTVTGGTFNSGAFNGTLGATTASTVAATTISSTNNVRLSTTTQSVVAGNASTVSSSSNYTAIFQVVGGLSGVNLEKLSADSIAPSIYGQKNRSGTAGTYTTGTLSGDGLAFWAGEGADGVSAMRRGASINITAAADFSATSSPGRIAFGTTAVGAVATTSRMTIDEAGIVSILGSTDSTSSTTGIGVVTGGLGVAKNVYVGKAVLSVDPTAGIGYATGAGGTVTQATSRTTGVTLNKITGTVTLVSAAGSASYQSFTLTDSAIAATDYVDVVQVSGTDKYIILVTAIASGSCQITYATTGGTSTEQPVFKFTVIKSVNS